MTKRNACQWILWCCIVACQAFAADEPRFYSGSIQVPTLGKLGMTLGIQDTDEGTFILLTVPTQGATNVPLEVTFLKDGSMTASLQQAQLTFVVQENLGQTRLTGHMEQGLTFPIEFNRVSSLPTLNRPQNPIGPFPYTEREVTALHPDGFLLQGTLTIPNGRGPFPCAVMISGSGQQDRDESIMGHRPFLIIADYLSRIGIAVLRYDDRGVGGSEMEDYDLLRNATSVDFATDASVMVHAARLHPEIDARRVGVIGHSEGGLIGPLVAVNDDKIAFVIMLAGPGVPGKELLPVQQGMLLQATGASPEHIDSVVNASMSFYESMEADASEEELREQMAELVGVQLAAAGVELTEEVYEEAIDEGLETMMSPWMIFFLFHDPAPVLAEVRCPVLALNGTLDVQVSYSQNLPAIEEAMLVAEGELTIVKLEGLNHLFQPAITGAVSEYGQIETTFDPMALEVMSDWVLEVTDAD